MISKIEKSCVLDISTGICRIVDKPLCLYFYPSLTNTQWLFLKNEQRKRHVYYTCVSTQNEQERDREKEKERDRERERLILLNIT